MTDFIAPRSQILCKLLLGKLTKSPCKKGDFFVFTKDTEFASPSAAAAVIHGGGANGLTAWKDASGKSLKEIEEN